MTKNQQRFLAWLNGAVVAVIGGIVTSASAWFIAPDTFNLAGGLPRMLQLLGMSAGYHLITYMKQSPLPTFDWEDESPSQPPNKPTNQ